jgi:hypothetical protein
MTSSPTFIRNSKISDQISKIKTRIPSGILKHLSFIICLFIIYKFKAGTTLNIHMLRINKQSNRADFQLNLDLTSILSDFDGVEKQNLESNQVRIYINKISKMFFNNFH